MSESLRSLQHHLPPQKPNQTHQRRQKLSPRGGASILKESQCFCFCFEALRALGILASDWRSSLQEEMFGSDKTWNWILVLLHFSYLRPLPILPLFITVLCGLTWKPWADTLSQVCAGTWDLTTGCLLNVSACSPLPDAEVTLMNETGCGSTHKLHTNQDF